MTYSELYRSITAEFEVAGCESAGFDASCLFERFAGIPRGRLALKGEDTVPTKMIKTIEKAAEWRANGYPLQYILGEWDFLSLTLYVGEGVLIPRSDTELLCEVAAERLKGIINPQVLDLCAGSGCVGLGIADLCKGTEVTAVELSERALGYLKRNCAKYPELNVTPVKADVLKDSALFKEGYDAILANPPYIPTDKLDHLMREVKHEPKMALDGGDGLVFYRAIARDWLPLLKKGGICAVEVGIGQSQTVAELFKSAGLTDIKIFKDMGNIERVVMGNNKYNAYLILNPF
ncbi:MAG: peptide chain release factor N(5)-glutamine methyltransferase [Oscillospiraceae bacterium]|nr:peptide chain release factor N(5)-glutamine methyltransferase [Oscillospiraceae bacterium]MDD4413329.1 peptide chain release factor N(5)-glutamine methyltransferase [Oscillospiraceae bacterium]